ncbi:putative signal transducing protein [Silvimonas amylolytica]|uniref:DUF2007 domain-containing protein n=1 Tax=Silvimonas amylolytica TaxID=449663 RepID=A0ABQ2PQ49_9NEIS|nr:DUF2007 domain-containing protein [Silvimonas amylolytica]GGP27112.1 hypothetical protein GCM10010971_29310 [Silvimonas amylolytica]
MTAGTEPNRIINCHPPDPATLVTLRRYDLLPEAATVRGLLESHGIPVRLRDVNFVQADGLMSIAAGGMKLEVPADRVEEAQALLASMAAGELIDADAPADAPPPMPPANPMPALWSPDGAALLCLLAGSWLPMLLHYQNWRRLGDLRRTRQALVWLVGSLVLMGAMTIYFVGYVHDIHALAAVGTLVFTPLTLIWYWRQGRAQSLLVLPWSYPRRPLWLAGWLGVLVSVGFWAGVTLMLQWGVPLQDKVADFAAHLNSEGVFQRNENFQQLRFATEGTTLVEVVKVSGVYITPEFLAQAHQSSVWQSCKDLALAPLLQQGMTLESRFVAADGTPLGETRLTWHDCPAY